MKVLRCTACIQKKTRRLNEEMKESFDVLLFDLQDTGCRIYTYLTTLFYLIEDCAQAGKHLIILDRPNPLGRFIEGNRLRDSFQSFVGAAPLPMSHGLTLGELSLWYKNIKNLKADMEVAWMEGYKPDHPWDKSQPWIMPSPNITGLSCAKCYPGAVLLEGTRISEGRGTTKPFEIFGWPDMKTKEIKQWIESQGPSFLKACFLRELQFEPAFDKHQKTLCSGFQIHLEKSWAGQGVFRPYRLISLFLKAFRNFYPSEIWKNPPPYEYEYQLEPIDIISGSEDLKIWVEDSSVSLQSWDDFLNQ